jgi:hypothetical protein
MEWLAVHGLDLSPVQQLKRVLAILGPVLSSLPLTGACSTSSRSKRVGGMAR